jgi:hypothetical protein
MELDAKFPKLSEKKAGAPLGSRPSVFSAGDFSGDLSGQLMLLLRLVSSLISYRRYLRANLLLVLAPDPCRQLLATVPRCCLRRKSGRTSQSTASHRALIAKIAFGAKIWNNHHSRTPNSVDSALTSTNSQDGQ